MTWRAPNDLERFVLRQPLDAQVLALARSLVLAPRIEPLLLRNARRRFLPASGAELESRLWFSPLVASRGSGEIVLHLGIACVLAGGIQGVARCADADPQDGGDPALPEDPAAPPLQLDQLWAFTREHTRHWPAADRLERDLRYHALRGDDPALAEGIAGLLAEIAREGDETRRIALARLAKRTLPGIHRRLGPAAGEQTRQLARYAALALQDGGPWSDAAGEPAALPRWLAERLPPPLVRAELGVEVRGDAANPVLHLLEPTAGTPVIALPTPLPARLHVRAGSAEGAWHSITRGSCIPLDPPGTVVELTTLDGRRWLLRAEVPEAEQAADLPPPLRLVHAAADETAAKAIAELLRGQGIPIELIAETEPGRLIGQTDEARSVRLWTRSANALWGNADIDQAADDDNLFLRIDDAKPVGQDTDNNRLLDWPDWKRPPNSPRAQALGRALRCWRREGRVLEIIDQPIPTDERGSANVLDQWLSGGRLKVYLSYREADGQTIATQIAEMLNQRGYDVQRELKMLDGGHVVQEVIDRQLADASMLLVLDTPRAGESEWIAREVESAFARFTPIIPIVLRPTGLEGYSSGPSVNAISPLSYLAVTVSISSEGIVEHLDNNQLDLVLSVMEMRFCSMLDHRQALRAKIEQTLRLLGFDVQPLAAQGSLFTASRSFGFDAVRLLVSCSTFPPTDPSAVNHLMSFQADDGAEFHYRLYVYEPPLPKPTLRRLARDHAVYRDPALILLDPRSLAESLNRIQTKQS